MLVRAHSVRSSAAPSRRLCSLSRPACHTSAHVPPFTRRARRSPELARWLPDSPPASWGAALLKLVQQLRPLRGRAPGAGIRARARARGLLTAHRARLGSLRSSTARSRARIPASYHSRALAREERLWCRPQSFRSVRVGQFCPTASVVDRGSPPARPSRSLRDRTIWTAASGAPNPQCSGDVNARPASSVQGVSSCSGRRFSLPRCLLVHLYHAACGLSLSPLLLPPHTTQRSTQSGPPLWVVVPCTRSLHLLPLAIVHHCMIWPVALPPCGSCLRRAPCRSGGPPGTWR